MTRPTIRWLAVAALAACGVAAAPARAGAQSHAPAAPNTYPDTVFAPALRDAPAVTNTSRLTRQVVDYQTREAPGTVVIDTPNTYLFLVLGNRKALRYGIGVGRDGFSWSGVETISRMAEWPDWYPPAEMIARQPYLPRFMAGGPGNPLGARALYLGNSEYRIHGTNDPTTIGHRVSSGCIRLTNEDIVDLYGRVREGTRVVVLAQAPRRAPEARAAAPLASASLRPDSGFAFGLH